MIYLAFGVIVVMIALFVSAQAGRLSARAVKLSVLALVFAVAAAALVVLAIAGRYGLAAPAGAFALWAMRAWLLARQLRSGTAEGQQTPPQPPQKSGMTRAEALDILGLEADATPDAIEAAYKALIVKNHPDQGGTDWLAARLNEARDTLLNGKG